MAILKNGVKTLLFVLCISFPMAINAQVGEIDHISSGFLGSDEHDTRACINVLEAENRECMAEVVCIQTTEDSKSPEVNVDTTQEISETSEEKPYSPLKSGKRREKELAAKKNKNHEPVNKFSFVRKFIMFGSFFLTISALVAAQS